MGLINFSLGDISDTIKSVREAITGEAIVDPVALAKIDYDLKVLEQALLSGQIAVNTEEAKHPSRFVAGWRPAIGWIAAIALAFMYIPRAIMMTYMWSLQCLVEIDMGTGVIPQFPDLGAMDIIGLVTSMLGIAVMRTYDKKSGIDTKIMDGGKKK